MTDQPSNLQPPASRLCDFLRTRRADIIGDWTTRMRALSPARDLSVAAIVDHLPQILTRISDIVESVHTGQTVSLEDLPRLHAVDRLGRGFDLDEIVTEFSLLRRSIVHLWRSTVGPTIDVGELANLDLAFDESIRQSVVRYAQARERLLKALDRISEAALGSTDLELFLQNLLRATLESTESVDTAVVLLREGERLRVRAAVGLEEDLHNGFSVEIGEGFAGLVAAERQPLLVRDAATDSRVVSKAIRGKGVRALYGVPMTRDDKVVGVAHIGSLRAPDFSDEDKLLFRAMVSRATIVIVQAQLVADLRRAETAQRFLSEASRQLTASLDYHTTLANISRLAVPDIADGCVVDLVEGGAIRRVSVAHTNPEKERLAHHVQERYPTDPQSSTGVARVLRTGRSEWHAEVTDAQLASIARDGEHLDLLRRLGIKSYAVVPIASREQVFGTIALVTAESGRRYSEADLLLAEDLGRRAASAIENARLYTEARNATELRERVLAIVSHDLRNQLGVVAGNALLLSRKASALAEGGLTRPLDAIQRTALSMEKLVEDLLDMAAIQGGRLSVAPAVRELKPILVESCDDHQPLAHEKGLRLGAHLPIDDVKVICDRDRILQVLANLFGNAIKFCRAGDAITIRAETQDGEVLVVVSDTGPGIPGDEIDRIFQPYKTVERHGMSGTGLGLYITKGIIERHGGRIWVESQVEKGTAVFFTLPRGK